jgi:reactive chlorine resistance protein C
MNGNSVSTERLGEEALRWSLVVIFLLFGIAKFTAYEAEGVAGVAEHYWLFGWLYPLGGVRFASGVIGTLELTTGLMLTLGSRFTFASLIGGLMGVCTFLVTLSFMIGAPTAFEAGYGFPFLGSSGQFLMKDLVLLAACFTLALTAYRRLASRLA